MPASVQRALPPQIVFSGIQPTGVPHLGNYVGALRQWVQLQQQQSPGSKLIFSIVDLHAITSLRCPKRLKQYKKESLAALLAVGVDPSRTTIFYQSSVSTSISLQPMSQTHPSTMPKVPAHSELMWILACTASFGYLSRMTQWKQKSAAVSPERHDISKLKLGLFAYPVLQAADILLHRATHVPVGQDQRQHLEFARECVTNFNHSYGPHLVYPETMTSPLYRVMSLADPTFKMSKSHISKRSRILITDTAAEIRAKIGSAVTDSFSGISYDVAARPGISNLLNILSVFDTQKRSPPQLAHELKGAQSRHLKSMVSEVIINSLGGIRERYLELLNGDQGFLNGVAAEGALKARQSAQETMDIVKAAMGL